MNALMESKKQTIVNFFEGTSNDYWKTLGEIAASTRITLDDVVTIIFSSKEFVKSSYSAENGQPVFTTRKVFEERAPFWTKLLGTLRNRID